MKKLIAILVCALFASTAFAQKDVPGEGRSAPAAKPAPEKNVAAKADKKVEKKAPTKAVQKKASVKKADKKAAAKVPATPEAPQPPVKK